MVVEFDLPDSEDLDFFPNEQDQETVREMREDLETPETGDPRYDSEYFAYLLGRELGGMDVIPVSLFNKARILAYEGPITKLSGTYKQASKAAWDIGLDFLEVSSDYVFQKFNRFQWSDNFEIRTMGLVCQ